MTNSYYGFILLYGLVINCYLYRNWELDVIILMDFHPVAEVKLFWSRPGRQIILVAASYILALSLLTPVFRICICDQLHPPLIFWDSVPGSIKLKKCLPLQSKANWITPHTFLAWMKPFHFWQIIICLFPQTEHLHTNKIWFLDISLHPELTWKAEIPNIFLEWKFFKKWEVVSWKTLNKMFQPFEMETFN